MIVAELIEKLKAFPQDCPVVFDRSDWGFTTVSTPRKIVLKPTTPDWYCEEFYPDLPQDEDDPPTIEAVVI